MIHIPIPDEVAKYSLNIVQTHNLGNRGYGDGTPNQQRIGVVGQKMIGDLLGLETSFEGGFDGGIDFTYKNKTYDVKTMGRDSYPEEYYVNNLMAVQSKYDVDRYIFCSLHKKDRVLTICGWIDKQELPYKARYYPEGTIRRRRDGTTFLTKSDLYEIQNKHLNISYSEFAFKHQLSK